jgi:two-component system, OmpR family, response regulator VicR
LKVLVVDDNRELLRVLRNSLEQDNYQVTCTMDGEDGLRLAYNEQPDVVILDIMMSGTDGWEVCRRLRDFSAVPIVFLTSRSSEMDIVRGLNYGADDFLTKPFSLAELKARLEAVLRRNSGSYGSHEDEVTFDDGNLRIDLQHNQVLRQGRLVALSAKEFQLLSCLVRRAGEVIPHAELLHEVWGAGYVSELSDLALYIRYLRLKIEDDASKPRYIHTRFRVGYFFGAEHNPGSVKSGDSARDRSSSQLLV